MWEKYEAEYCEVSKRAESQAVSDYLGPFRQEAILIFRTPQEYYDWVDSLARNQTPEEFRAGVRALQEGMTALRSCEYNPGDGVSCDCEPE